MSAHFGDKYVYFYIANMWFQFLFFTKIVNSLFVLYEIVF
jgi:hypothetical protein